MSLYIDPEITAINKVLPPFAQLKKDSSSAELWAALFRLYGEQVQGPKGYATWKDAAIATVMKQRADGVAIPRTVRQSSNQRDEKE